MRLSRLSSLLVRSLKSSSSSFPSRSSTLFSSVLYVLDRVTTADGRRRADCIEALERDLIYEVSSALIFRKSKSDLRGIPLRAYDLPEPSEYLARGLPLGLLLH